MEWNNYPLSPVSCERTRQPVILQFNAACDLNICPVLAFLVLAGWSAHGESVESIYPGIFLVREDRNQDNFFR